MSPSPIHDQPQPERHCAERLRQLAVRAFERYEETNKPLWWNVYLDYRARYAAQLMREHQVALDVL